jgi:hypothetical protein
MVHPEGARMIFALSPLALRKCALVRF